MTDKYASRRDYRTDEQCESNISHWTERELDVFKTWVNQHNKTRKKIDYVYFRWGSYTTETFTDMQKDKIKKYNKPDMLLCKLEDNQRHIQWIAPIEVCQTNVPFNRLHTIRIKKTDLKRYDDITPEIATRDQCILFSAGITPHEHCLLIGSNTLTHIKNTQEPEPFYGFGGKDAYSIPITTGMRKRTIPLRGDGFRQIAQTTL